MTDLTFNSPVTDQKLLTVNFSSRLGAPIQAIAVHSTESSDIPRSEDDLLGVRSWFNNPASQASSHVGIDGDGNIHRWVKDADKAWTILQLNPVTLNIEFVGRAAQPHDDWEERQLNAGAKMCAWWSLQHGIPLQKGEVDSINGFPVIVRKGIIRHSDLTAAGFGTHTDPGSGFWMGDFIERAQAYKKRGWVA